MVKFDAGKTSLVTLCAVLTISFLLLGKSLNTISAHHNDNGNGDPGQDNGGWSACVPSADCGTYDGNKTKTVYIDPIEECHSGYHHQDGGDWDKRCKKDDKCGRDDKDCHDEQEPDNSCPDGYTKIGEKKDAKCSKVITQSCKISEDDYKACAQTPAPTPVPPTCGSDEHLNLQGTMCLKFELGGAPPPPPASTQGQVLGASTMAGTGSFEENLYFAMMVIGGTITAFGIKGLKKASSLVK